MNKTYKIIHCFAQICDRNFCFVCANHLFWIEYVFQNMLCICLLRRKRQGECTFVFSKYGYTSLLLNQTKTKRKRQRDQREETVKHAYSKTKRIKNNQLNNNRWTNHELTLYGFVNIFSTRLLWLFFHNFFLESKRFFVLFVQKTCYLLEN